VALVGSLDDMTASTITSMVLVNNIQVVTHLSSDAAWLTAMYVPVRSISFLFGFPPVLKIEFLIYVGANQFLFRFCLPRFKKKIISTEGVRSV
jgi:hypothetical protein